MTVEQPFGVTIEDGDHLAVRVIVVGEVDLGSAPELREALAAAAAAGQGAVVVDLGGVSFLDSSGLNAILGARAGLQGRPLRVEGASSGVQKVLEVAGVAELLLPDGTAEEPHR